MRILKALPALSIAILLCACGSSRSTGPSGGKADDLAQSCPAEVGINSAEGADRRCFDLATGQFVPTACCADLCEGADWREQENGQTCAWVAEPGLSGAAIGQFAPTMCCRLNDAQSCGRAVDTGSVCVDPESGTEQDSVCCGAEPGECHAVLDVSVRECVRQQLESFAADPEVLPITPIEALEICTHEGDLTGRMLDEACASFPDAPFCGLTFEAFDRDFMQPCFEALRAQHDCAFGTTYSDLATLSNNTILRRRVLTANDLPDLSPLQRQQVVAAVGQTAFDDIDDASEAFAVVDDGQINLVDVFELGSARAFTAYELGAGDNSFGAIFEHGTTVMAAHINDGDLYRGDGGGLGCDVPFGIAGRLCTSDDACPGMRCEGQVEDHPVGELGKCVDLTLGQGSAQLESSCSAFEDCPLAEGLACSGLEFFGDDPGFCRPAWMFGRFEAEESVPIPSRGTVSRDLFVYGLATVPEDATVRLEIEHANFRDLRITLVPALQDEGTVATIFDGATEGTGMSGFHILERTIDHPGDESLNGTWTLVVEDTRAGGAGTLHGWELSFSSRFD